MAVSMVQFSLCLLRQTVPVWVAQRSVRDRWESVFASSPTTVIKITRIPTDISIKQSLLNTVLCVAFFHITPFLLKYKPLSTRKMVAVQQNRSCSIRSAHSCTIVAVLLSATSRLLTYYQVSSTACTLLRLKSKNVFENVIYFNLN